MIQNEEDRLITFSKRRSGVYKKASELVTLCGADVGVLIFSPSGKPFSYGHPSIDLVTRRLLLSHQANTTTMRTTTTTMFIDTSTHPIVEAHRRVMINKLNQQYNDLFGHLETEKECRKELQKMPIEEAVATPEGWWDASIEGMSLDELKQRQRSLEELHANISNHVRERINNNSPTEHHSTTRLLLPPPPAMTYPHQHYGYGKRQYQQ